MIVVSGCLPGAPTPSAPESMPPTPSEGWLEGVVIDRWEDDRLRYRVELERARLDRAIGSAHGEKVTIDVIAAPQAGAASETAARVTAPRARSELASKVITLSGGVRLVDREARIMETQEMTYDASSGRVDAKDEVRVEGRNFSARGRSMTGHPGAGDLDLAGPVELQILPVSR